jgi:hypothetical protein
MNGINKCRALATVPRGIGRNLGGSVNISFIAMTTKVFGEGSKKDGGRHKATLQITRLRDSRNEDGADTKLKDKEII